MLPVLILCGGIALVGGVAFLCEVLKSVGYRGVRCHVSKCWESLRIWCKWFYDKIFIAMRTLGKCCS